MSGGDHRFSVPAAGSTRTLPGPAPLRWGVLGASSTVARLAVIPAMVASPKAELVSVASLSGRAEVEGLDCAPRYEDVLEDPEVEAVYVPLPNHLHREWTLRALAAGKHVLCEKPLAVSTADAAAMFDCARANGRLLMEAYMTAHHPRNRALVEEVRAGRIGALRSATAAFTFNLTDARNHRWSPDAGGGALLDVGVYCVAPLVALAGRGPERVEAVAAVAPSGVDASLTGWLDFGGGFSATVECSFEAPELQRLCITGTAGRIEVTTAFTAGPQEDVVEVVALDGSVSRLETGGSDPYRGMVDHFQTVVRGGAPLRRTPADTLEVLGVLERLAQAAGLGAAA